jgi:hypothetical protein
MVVSAAVETAAVETAVVSAAGVATAGTCVCVESFAGAACGLAGAFFLGVTSCFLGEDVLRCASAWPVIRNNPRKMTKTNRNMQLNLSKY